MYLCTHSSFWTISRNVQLQCLNRHFKKTLSLDQFPSPPSTKADIDTDLPSIFAHLSLLTTSAQKEDLEARLVPIVWSFACPTHTTILAFPSLLPAVSGWHQKHTAVWLSTDEAPSGFPKLHMSCQVKWHEQSTNHISLNRPRCYVMQLTLYTI